VTIKNRLPLALSYDSNDAPSGLAEFLVSSTDLHDVATNHTPSQFQVLAFSSTGVYAPSTVIFPAAGASFSCGDLASCGLSSLGNVCNDAVTANGQVYAWNGTQFCPSTLQFVPTQGTGNVTVNPKLIFNQAPEAAVGLNVTSVGLNVTGPTSFNTTPKVNGTDVVVDSDLTPYLTKTEANGFSSTLLPTAEAAGFSATLLPTVEAAGFSSTLVVSSTAGANEIYYNNGTGPDGIATTTGSRAFISSDANFDDITNVTLTGDTKAQLILRTGDFITASSLNEGAINMLFGTAGDGAGEIDFTPSGSGGGATLVSENVSATNLSAINGTVTTAPTTANHVANKTYVDGINNTQHNRLFAVGTKTDSIANTSVYLGWEFDAVSALSVSDSGGVITIGGTGNTEITFGAAGDYMIDCTARANADNRIELFVKAEYYDNSNESPAFTSYNRLQASNYAARDTDQNTGDTTLHLLLSLNQNDKLRFSSEADADGTAVLLVNGTFLRIVKLA
jgi:hypothetical protein